MVKHVIVLGRLARARARFRIGLCLGIVESILNIYKRTVIGYNIYASLK